MQNQEIIKIIENLKGRKNYEKKKAIKLGFSSLYTYFEDKLLKEKNAAELKKKELVEVINTDNGTEDGNQSEEDARPIPMRPTTAAGFTDLGITLSVEGRHREAIDQLTKSIALDAQYALAWEKRAASYQVLGLNEKSSQDLEHLKGLPSN